MSGPTDRETEAPDDQEARRWLAALRTGGPEEKAQARRSLAEIFEARGMDSEAVELLVANARDGYRDAELFQTLARLYRKLGDEYLAASAALEATRLSGRKPARHPLGGQPHETQRGPWWSNHPSAHAAPPPVAAPPPDPSRVRPSSGPSQHQAPARPSPWRFPLRVAGWIAVLATVAGAGVVAMEHPASAILYLASAAALGLLLLGTGGARHLVRLPDGPLGDGALLFLWLLALLAAGALLPRPLAATQPPDSPTEAATPGVVRTPSPSPAPASSGSSPATPAASPTP